MRTARPARKFSWRNAPLSVWPLAENRRCLRHHHLGQLFFYLSNQTCLCVSVEPHTDVLNVVRCRFAHHHHQQLLQFGLGQRGARHDLFSRALIKIFLGGRLWSPTEVAGPRGPFVRGGQMGVQIGSTVGRPKVDTSASYGRRARRGSGRRGKTSWTLPAYCALTR